jgi:hypothetical protein
MAEFARATGRALRRGVPAGPSTEISQDRRQCCGDFHRYSVGRGPSHPVKEFLAGDQHGAPPLRDVSENQSQKEIDDPVEVFWLRQGVCGADRIGDVDDPALGVAEDKVGKPVDDRPGQALLNDLRIEIGGHDDDIASDRVDPNDDFKGIPIAPLPGRDLRVQQFKLVRQIAEGAPKFLVAERLGGEDAPIEAV